MLFISKKKLNETIKTEVDKRLKERDSEVKDEAFSLLEKSLRKLTSNLSSLEDADAEVNGQYYQYTKPEDEKRILAVLSSFIRYRTNKLMNYKADKIQTSVENRIRNLKDDSGFVKELVEEINKLQLKGK